MDYLCRKMADKLYIIGNGFDLHHGLSTTYLNFRDDYVIKKRPVLWNNLLDIYGDAPQNDKLWWMHFENMLGRVDYVSLKKLRNGEAMGASKVRSLMNGTLPPFFGEWIKGVDCCIDLSNIQLMDEIDANALFFTFNYTMLLEKAYNVNEDNVWHIHNSVKDYGKGENPIVGHDADAGQLVKYTQEYNKDQQRVTSSYADQINQEALNGAKKVSDRIWREEDRFNQYSDIKHFIAMGFSFNDIDLPYIKKIIDVNRNIADADWTLYIHSPKDYDAIDKLYALEINKNNIKTENW